VLLLNVHLHTLVLDGVFTTDATGTARFDPAPPPTDREVARLVATIARRVERLLRRRGLVADEDVDTPADPMAEDAPALAALSRASVMGQSVLGRRPGAPVLRLGRDPDAPWVTSSGPRHAHLHGFDLHANRTVRAHDRIGAEKLCRYLLRQPLGQERLERADLLYGLAMAHLPATLTLGIVHRDLCPENLITDARGRLISVDNGSMTIGAIDEDLCRVWYRWPMTAGERKAFVTGYEEYRSADGFGQPSLFWVVVVIVNSARARLRSSATAAAAALQRLDKFLSEKQANPQAQGMLRGPA
jgi:hypothetical protein